jgi:hypothetical protein
LYSVIDDGGQPSSFVSYDGLNHITMSPSLLNPASNGVYLLYFRAEMQNYPGNYYDIPFYVTVTDCTPTIDANSVSIANFFQPWGADAAQIPTFNAFN